MSKRNQIGPNHQKRSKTNKANSILKNVPFFKGCIIQHKYNIKSQYETLIRSSIA